MTVLLDYGYSQPIIANLPKDLWQLLVETFRDEHISTATTFIDRGFVIFVRDEDKTRAIQILSSL